MKCIEKKLREVKAIRLLTIFDIGLIVICIIAYMPLGFFNPATYMFGSLLIVCLILQFVLYFVPKGKIKFDSTEITIESKYLNTKISWEEVNHIYFNSFSYIFIFLRHYTMDLSINVNGKMIDIEDVGDVKIYKQEYKEIISFIPRSVLDNNEFMIYRNQIEREKNEYKI